MVDLPDRLLPDVGVQSPDHPVLLKQRNEHAGAEHPKYRMLPTDEGFRAVQHGAFAAHIVFGLVVYLELFLTDGLFEILGQFFREQFLLIHLRVIGCDAFAVVAAQLIRRRLRPVKPLLHAYGFIHVPVNAHPQTDLAGVAVFIFNAFYRKGQHVRIVVAVGTVDHEDIFLPPADDTAGLLHRVTEISAYMLQNLVCTDPAVAVDDQVEPVNVYNERVHRILFVILVVTGRVVIKIFAIVQAGQRVSLRRMDDLPVLRQLNYAADPGEYDPFRRIGLGDKVHRAKLKTFHFGFLVRCHDDHRELRPLRGLFQLLQHGDACHDGHQKVKQNQRDLPLAACDFLQRFLTVFREDHIIFIRESHPQDLSVDLFIIHDQNQSFLCCLYPQMTVGHFSPPI